jgi:phage regulator Rha-like protein
MEKEFSPQYAYVASDNMSLIVKIARYVGRQYQELLESIESLEAQH